ncbi:hypothetical protein GOV13_02670 [Candidatus Pacearchaeota archaeon]|nr:hypothetical protein [Candidatus Pacearchaeota archaeon]
MKYKIKHGRRTGTWESNLPESFLLPLRLFELPIEDVQRDFEQDERVFVLEDLDENRVPPHKIGNSIYLSETQAKVLIKKLSSLLSDSDKRDN